MHTNMSLFRDGKNVFFDLQGERSLSKGAYHFIAGLLVHVSGMTVITSPLVNSYKRLASGYEPLPYRLVRLQSLCAHPHSCGKGLIHARRTALPGFLL